MAKFCGNCGTPLEDNAKICNECGMPFDDVSEKNHGLKEVESAKKKKKKKIVKLVVSLAFFIAVSMVAYNVTSQYIGYNGLLRKVMIAYENYDIDTLISLSSDMYYYVDEDWVEFYFENNVGQTLDSFESSVGHSYKLSYEVNETYAMSERKFDERLNEIENSYENFDVSVIEKIIVADLTLTAKQGNKSVDRDMDVVMAKEDGSWKLLYIE